MSDIAKDWDPGAYDRFRDSRLIPALDLLAAVGPLPKGDVVDLGCGTGAAAQALAERFCAVGRRDLIGVDSSEAMLRTARGLSLYTRLERMDIATWEAQSPPALIFSNATLHWLPDHAVLVPRLAGMLRPGGWLAVQMPGQNAEPSHAAWRDLSRQSGTAVSETPAIETPERYLEILSPLGIARIWETRYYQLLPPTARAIRSAASPRRPMAVRLLRRPTTLRRWWRPMMLR